jgi:2-polyprenyl-3-methyl-5-hydroxy-6-metoxy-1,4-benzoquinol methylase
VSDCPECVLCQSGESTLVQVGARHAPEAEVRRCTGCGLVFLWPRPSEEELDRYYTELYREDYVEPPVEVRYWADLNEANTRVRRLLPFLKRETYLLEVGCGSGAFLGAVRAYVAEVHGVEPDAASRAWIEGRMGMRVSADVADVLREGKSFDLVVLVHVLEHVPNPVRFLRGLRQLLQPDGSLLVEVPNVSDMLVAVYQIPAYLGFYYQKAHLYYFSKDTLAMALSQAGFDAAIEGIQRYDLSNHIRWMLTGQPGGQGYYNDILLPSVQATYADAVIRAGHSDTLWAIAQLSGKGE